MPEICELCGSEELEYIGEAYEDDGFYLGSSHVCKECGHTTIIEASFEFYDEPRYTGDDDE